MLAGRALSTQPSVLEYRYWSADMQRYACMCAIFIGLLHHLTTATLALSLLRCGTLTHSIDGHLNNTTMATMGIHEGGTAHSSRQNKEVFCGFVFGSPTSTRTTTVILLIPDDDFVVPQSACVSCAVVELLEEYKVMLFCMP